MNTSIITTLLLSISIATTACASGAQAREQKPSRNTAQAQKADQSSEKKTTMADCSDCTKIVELTNFFRQLTYTKKADRDNGGEKVSDVIDLLQNFQKQAEKRKGGKAQFRQLVVLTTEALPYDPVSSTAEYVDAIMHDQPDLRGVYQEVLRTVGTTCEARLLESLVREFNCVAGDIKSGNYENPNKKPEASKCDSLKIFNYETCLKSPAGR